MRLGRAQSRALAASALQLLPLRLLPDRSSHGLLAPTSAPLRCCLLQTHITTMKTRFMEVWDGECSVTFAAICFDS